MNIYYYKKIDLDIPRFWKEIFLMVRPILLLTIAVFFINRKLPFTDNWINFFVQAALFAILYLLVIYKWSVNHYEKSLIKGAIYKLKSR